MAGAQKKKRTGRREKKSETNLTIHLLSVFPHLLCQVYREGKGGLRQPVKSKESSSA